MVSLPWATGAKTAATMRRMVDAAIVKKRIKRRNYDRPSPKKRMGELWPNTTATISCKGTPRGSRHRHRRQILLSLHLRFLYTTSYRLIAERETSQKLSQKARVATATHKQGMYFTSKIFIFRSIPFVNTLNACLPAPRVSTYVLLCRSRDARVVSTSAYSVSWILTGPGIVRLWILSSPEGLHTFCLSSVTYVGTH